MIRKRYEKYDVRGLRKKFGKVLSVALAGVIAVTAGGITTQFPVFAEDKPEMTSEPNMEEAAVRDVECKDDSLNTIAADSTMVMIQGRFITDTNAALARINEIRYEACKNGYPNPANPSQKLTLSDYTPIKWSTGLEQHARIRATEAGIAYKALGSGHSRLNGTSIWANVDNMFTCAECIAYNWGTSVVSGINQWYGEKDDWVSQNSNAVVGHYTSMINPLNEYIGLGDFYVSSDSPSYGMPAYPNVLVAQFGRASGTVDETQLSGTSDQYVDLEVLNKYVSDYQIDGPSTVGVGSQKTLSATAYLKINSVERRCPVGSYLTYVSSNPSIASVTAAGAVTGHKEGSVTISLKNGSTVVATKKVNVGTSPTEAFVIRLYKTCLGRTPDASGVGYWDNLLTSKKMTGAEVAYSFVFSKEYTSKNVSDDTYIDMLYSVFMDRKADSSGKAYWKGMMQQGVSRTYVFRGFAQSAEFTKICRNYGIERGTITLKEARDQNVNLTKYVCRIYTKALGRSYDVNGLNYWCGAILNKEKTAEQAAEAFILSKEFESKNLSNEEYLKVLYRTFMGREADQAGLNYWIGQMKKGSSRKTILHQFATSPEFKKIQASFGL